MVVVIHYRTLAVYKLKKRFGSEAGFRVHRYPLPYFPHTKRYK